MNKIVRVFTEKELSDAVKAHFMVTASSNTNIVSKIELGNDIGLTQTLDIPNEGGFDSQVFTRQNNKGLIIDLCGNCIYDATANDLPGLDCLIRRKPLNQKAALDSVTWSLQIINGKLKGKRFASNNLTGTLLYLGATFNSIVGNIQLESAKNGIFFRFSMMGRIQNVITNNIDEKAIYVGIGDWPGAGINTSQSNGTLIEQVRVFNEIGATAFHIESSSQVKISKCISEGKAPKYHLLVTDENNTTTVQDFVCEDFYIEAVGTIKIKTKAGHKVLKNIWMQNPTKFDFEALAAVATIYMQNIPFWPTGSKLEVFGSQSNLALRAEEVGVDLRNPDLWLNSETVFPKLSSEIKGMPRYITFISSILNKYCSNTDLRINGMLNGPIAPMFLKTNIPSSVAVDSAKGTASAGNFDGGMFITKRGVVARIGSTQPPTVDTKDAIYIDESNGEGIFNYELKGLLPKTTYTIRSFAYNGKGTSYGEPVIITTLAQ